MQQQIGRGHFRIISDSGVVSFDDFESQLQLGASEVDVIFRGRLNVKFDGSTTCDGSHRSVDDVIPSLH